jgi:hypothetical protein
MDPLMAALPETVRLWYAEKRESLSVLHDRQAALDTVTVEEAVHHLRNPLPEFRRFNGPVAIKEIVQVDSKSDPRVQVADLIAGMGRVPGTMALAGTTPPLDARNLVAGVLFGRTIAPREH